VGTVRVSGVSGGGWKGEAVRRGVKISEDEEAVDNVEEEGIVAMAGSVRRRYRPETT
jgi:hypothetical protein